MENVVILLVLALCGTNAIFVDESASNRITNAQETSITNFPYSVSMQFLALVGTPTRGHKCGGVLITFQHVVTAATCAFNLFNGSYVPINNFEYRIFAGATLLSEDNDLNRIRNIDNFTLHPDYIHPPASLNNIGVITLNAPYLNTTVTPIALPAATFAPADFTVCQIASWGAQVYTETASSALRFTNKYVYNQNLCQSLYSQLPLHLNVFSSMICAASFDIISSGCNGDMGIPLICNGGLAGIMIETNECAVSSFPEVYTRVSNYTEWIRSISGSSTIRPELAFLGVLAMVIVRFVSQV